MNILLHIPFKKFLGVIKLFLLLLILSLPVFLKISGSSLGMYCIFVNIGCSRGDSVLLGQSRPIRSDEWLVNTPYLVSQNVTNNLVYNNLIGENNSVSLLTNASVSNWTTVLKPFSLSFLILPYEYAFTIYWLTSTLMLPVILYFIFRKLGLNNLHAILMSLTFLLISFFQWWNAFPAVSLPLSLILFVQLWVENKNLTLKKILIYFIVATYLLTVTLLQLYPPYQISLLYLVLFIYIGIIVYSSDVLNRKYIVQSLIFALFVLMGVSLIIFSYYKKNMTEFKAVTSSSYPGQRTVLGGDFPQFRLMSGFYDVQLLNDHKPMGPYNQSEAAGFFHISLFLLPIIIVNEFLTRKKHKKNDWLIVSLVLYMAFIAGWMFVGYPSWFARISLLERVPAHRAQIGFGVASFILTALYVYKYKLEIPGRLWKYLVGVVAFFTILYTGLYLKETYPTYISSIPKIVLISGFSSFIVLSAVNQWKKTFGISLLIFSLITAGTVHPIRQGLGPITNSQFIKQVKEINTQSSARWAVYNNNILSPLLYANGVQSATGVYLYPQEAWWVKFDPSSSYRDIWNRYAHVYFLEPEIEKKDQIEFKLVQLDSFAVLVDPCNPMLDEVNIKYLASNIPLKSKCVAEIPKNGYEHGIFIYQRDSTTAK